MRNIIAIIVLAIFWQACSECNRIDCAVDDQFDFNFLSAQTNENLVFGPNPGINRAEIEVYSMEGGEKKLEALNFHSIGFIHFTPKFTQSEYFVEAAGKVDTLLFTYDRSGKGKCCGPVNLIAEVRVNNVIQTPDSSFYTKLFR